MKKLLIIISFSVFATCQTQIKQKKMMPQINNKFEKFDIKTFNENINPDESFILLKSADGIQQLQEQSYGFINRLFYQENQFVLIKKFYKNYNLKEKGLLFNEGSPIGIWYYFDESGRLIKEENTDEGYSFTPEKIVKYCEKNKIELPKGYHESGFYTRVRKDVLNGKKVWVIEYLIPDGDIQKVVLDGQSGAELEKKVVPFVSS
ncbi:hypothetical protein LIV57_17305 [Chryseobacterium sp. X308]|uniref:hypothetical protein n=1 Tax=Chryseobacterium sp. X308 TaxID=2884873 RepID=UPI001D15E1E0|nr:hypothetical protein [Chryseobacterium sp. X308]MCC3217027.1 hypothetical protein [Chryseobacterium sp. X308]